MQTPVIERIKVFLLEPVNTSWCLEQICDSNYQKLFQLIPNLKHFDHYAVGVSHSSHPQLFLKIIEQNPYTLTIELSHQFSQLSELMLPAVTIRIYLDAQLAEVLCDVDRPIVSRVFQDPGNLVGIRQYKWRLNYFLQKWLDFCMKADYQFKASSPL